MLKNFNRFILFGIIFTFILGTLLHFVYGWSGSNVIVGIFSPVNESVWEHLKLLYFPMSLWIFLGYSKFGKNNCNYLLSAIIGFLCGVVSIPVLFYLYTFFTQKSILVIDIIIFIIGIVIIFLVMAFVYKNYAFRCRPVKLILIWELIFILFVIFTIFPPDFFLFKS